MANCSFFYILSNYFAILIEHIMHSKSIYKNRKFLHFCVKKYAEKCSFSFTSTDCTFEILSYQRLKNNEFAKD